MALVGIEPVLVKADVFLRKFESAEIPSFVPRISGRAMVLDTSFSMSRCWENLVHSLRMCSLVSRVSLSQGHVTGSCDSGRNERRKSPVYEWPVRHWMTRPKTSRLFVRFLKCVVGLREGLSLLAIAYLPTLGEFFQSICHSLRDDDLARLFALEYVTLKGIWRSSSVASFASLSALSFPVMPQWLGHQEIDIFRLL